MKKTSHLFLSILALSCLTSRAAERLQDTVSLLPVDPGKIWGLGIVAGLNNPAPSQNYSPETLQRVCELAGLPLDDWSSLPAHAAFVFLTAKISPEMAIGEKLDVEVRRLGQNQPLAGGLLLTAKLYGLDQAAYARAQGKISVSESQTPQQTEAVGTIPSGAVLERRIEASNLSQGAVLLWSNHPDTGKTSRALTALEASVQTSVRQINPDLWQIALPRSYPGTPTEFAMKARDFFMDPAPAGLFVIRNNLVPIQTRGGINTLLFSMPSSELENSDLRGYPVNAAERGNIGRMQSYRQRSERSIREAPPLRPVSFNPGLPHPE